MITQKAIDLILEAENIDFGSWPGGASGYTIGYGYDLGYKTPLQFGEDWRPWLSFTDFIKIRPAVGVTGKGAGDLAKKMGKVHFPPEAPLSVFSKREIPRVEADTLRIFPGADRLPPDAYGALVSLVFNRGTRLTDRDPQIQERREMRQIADAVKHGDLPRIAVALRSMSRLWTGHLPKPYDVKMGGLVKRREAEARLVEGTATELEGVPS